MKITDDIKYIGVNDHRIDLFEGQYLVPDGMSYNSYLILDEKIAIMDTVDTAFTQEWLDHIRKALGKQRPSYLIIHHMEPDHSASIASFVTAYPEAQIVASVKTFDMIQNFYGIRLSSRQLIVVEGSTLSLGKHTLTFLTAPMVHWPEVIVSYDSTDKVLFSADGFGRFGALDVIQDWTAEARRYYFGIVGKYGAAVQNLLKKAATLDICMICPLHGPVLDQNPQYYLGLYHIWSSYEPEEEGILIAYTSIYGNTKKAVMQLAEKLKKQACPKIVIRDLARCDMTQAVADAFRYSKLVLATTTYNGDIFPFMRQFLHCLTGRNFSNHTVAFIENGSWAPMAAKIMKGMLEKSKNLTFTETNVTIMSALNDESTAQLSALAWELCMPKSIRGQQNMT